MRISRLRKRELALLGHVNEEFIAWAAQYDVGTMDGRSLGRHLAWLEERRCQILRLSGATRVSELVSIVRKQVNT